MHKPDRGHACRCTYQTEDKPIDVSLRIRGRPCRCTHQTKNEPVDGDDAALPDEVVQGLDVLVDVDASTAGRHGELTDEVVSERAQVH